MRPVLGLALVAFGGFAGWMIISGKWPAAPGTASGGSSLLSGLTGDPGNGGQPEPAQRSSEIVSISSGGSTGGTRR